jgi:uncharacterized protein (TIGR02328 family)
MRLWAEQLMGILPDMQLKGQHRECCALRGKGWGKKHATVDYVFTHSPLKLVAYHWRLMLEIERRKLMKLDTKWFNPAYRGKLLGYGPTVLPAQVVTEASQPIYPEHKEEYLMECLDNIIGKLKEKLYKYIDKYGMTDPRTVSVSQELDKFITEKQREMNKKL